MNELNICESLIVGVDFTNDADVLIVGRQTDGKMDIVNVFRGQEAADIYRKLITVKKGEKKNG